VGHCKSSRPAAEAPLIPAIMMPPRRPHTLSQRDKRHSGAALAFARLRTSGFLSSFASGDLEPLALVVVAAEVAQIVAS